MSAEGLHRVGGSHATGRGVGPGRQPMKVPKLLRVVLYHLSALVPRSPRQVLFGAWNGHRYSDNPRYLYEFALEHRPRLRVTWCGRAGIEAHVPHGERGRFVTRGSLGAIWATLRASTVFVSHGHGDLHELNLTAGATVVYLGHGLAIKNMGALGGDRPVASHPLVRWLQRVWRAPERFSFFVASSQTHKDKLLAEYASMDCREDNTLILGQPRADVFVHAAGDRDETATRARLAQEHGVPTAKRLVVYMPTFRDDPTRTFSFTGLHGEPADRLRAILERHDAVLVERSHFVDGVLRGRAGQGGSPAVIDLSAASDVDSTELLLATDLLITDYSGAYVEFLLLDRPVLHFVHDYEEYIAADRGLYFDLREVAGGPLLGDLDELLDALDAHLEDPARGSSRRGTVRATLLTRERGHSCRDVADRFLDPLLID